MAATTRDGVARDVEARAAAALELARILDGATVARLIEAAELHAAVLDRLDDRTDTGGDLDGDVRRLHAASVFLREVNGVRPMLRLADRA